jgi:hypothetical protein
LGSDLIHRKPPVTIRRLRFDCSEFSYLVFYVFGNIDQVAHRGDERGLGQYFQIGHHRKEQVFPCFSSVLPVVGEEVLADLLEQLLGA